MLRLFLLALLLATPLCVQASVLTMHVALERAHAAHPSIRALESDVQMRRALIAQAGKLKNPDVSIFVEDIDGSRFYGGWRLAQITYSIAQEFDIWNKRHTLVELARQEELVAAFEASINRQAVRKTLVERFFAAYALQEKLRIAQERLTASQEGLEVICAHTEEGKCSFVEKRVEEMHVIRHQLAVDAARLALQHAYHLLSLHMGCQTLDFHELEYAFHELIDPVQEPAPCTQLENHPLLASLHAKVDLSRQRITAEKRAYLPNPQVLLGFRQLPGLTPRCKRAYSFVAGVSFPLIAWDRNQGAICAAKWQLEGDVARLEAARRQLHAELAERRQELASAHHYARMHAHVLIPKAKEYYETSYASYLEGMLTVAEWNAARQEWWSLQEELIDLLLIYHQKKEALDHLLEMLNSEIA